MVAILRTFVQATFDEVEYFSGFTSDIVDVRNEWQRLIYSYSQVRVLFHILQLMVINKIFSYDNNVSVASLVSDSHAAVVEPPLEMLMQSVRWYIARPLHPMYNIYNEFIYYAPELKSGRVNLHNIIICMQGALKWVTGSIPLAQFQWIPYSGKVWRGKSLANLVNSPWFAKLKPSKIVLTMNNLLADLLIR